LTCSLFDNKLCAVSSEAADVEICELSYSGEGARID
jgi:hypothetical protein